MSSWITQGKLPKRYILALLGFLGFVNAFILRSNLSIAIVSMVAPATYNASVPVTVRRSSPTDDCSRARAPFQSGYPWSIKTQGYILSAFFYSYAAMQIPAGFLATTLGGRNLFGGSIGVCALLTLFTTLSAYLGPMALFVLRLLEGLSSVSMAMLTVGSCARHRLFRLKGFVYPSLHAMWAKWAPKDDKSKLATFAFAGRLRTLAPRVRCHTRAFVIR